MRWLSATSMGDLDLVMSRDLASPLLWRNNQGVFTNVTATSMPNITQISGGSVLAGDVDGDGDKDLLFPSGSGPLLPHAATVHVSGASVAWHEGHLPLGTAHASTFDLGVGANGNPGDTLPIPAVNASIAQ